jgi:uncharacterized protein involved in type VI secretion and phage assembly
VNVRRLSELSEREARHKIFGVVVGVVTNNKDDDGHYRVKVKFPWMPGSDGTEEESHWCRVTTFMAGNGRGGFFLPEVNDEVLVAFEHGEISQPYVVGALWNGKDKPHDKNPGGNPRRVIKSRGGSKITFDDDQMKLIIEDGGGKGRITFDSNNNKILIEALEGDVCFQSPQGDMKIVAKTAELKAGQNLEVHAGSDMKWGTDAKATLNGQSVTLSGAKVNMNCGAAQAPQAPTASPKDVDDPYGS